MPRAAAPAAPAVEIDTAALATKAKTGRTAWVRIGGEVFEAHCPKDSVLVTIYQDEKRSLSLVVRFMEAMLGKAPAARVAEMLHDPDNLEVSITTLYQLVQYLLNDDAGPRWADQITDQLKAIGSGPKPRTIPVKKAAAPAKKSSTRRAAVAAGRR